MALDSNTEASEFPHRLSIDYHVWFNELLNMHGYRCLNKAVSYSRGSLSFIVLISQF